MKKKAWTLAMIIIALFGFFAADAATGHKLAATVIRVARSVAQSLEHQGLDDDVRDLEEQVAAEERALESDIAKIDDILAGASRFSRPPRHAELESARDQLIRSRQILNRFRKEELARLYSAQLKREEIARAKSRLDSAKFEIASTAKLVAIETKLEAFEMERVVPKVVDRFFSLLSGKHHADLIAMCSPDVGYTLVTKCPSALHRVTAGTPYSLRAVSGECEVIIGGETALRLAKVNDDWKVVALMK